MGASGNIFGVLSDLSPRDRILSITLLNTEETGQRGQGGGEGGRNILEMTGIWTGVESRKFYNIISTKL